MEGIVNRDDAVYLAKLAEQAERYDDMVCKRTMRGGLGRNVRGLEPWLRHALGMVGWRVP